jgi:hypothetical protein
MGFINHTTAPFAAIVLQKNKTKDVSSVTKLDTKVRTKKKKY